MIGQKKQSESYEYIVNGTNTSAAPARVRETVVLMKHLSTFITTLFGQISLLFGHFVNS